MNTGLCPTCQPNKPTDILACLTRVRAVKQGLLNPRHPNALIAFLQRLAVPTLNPVQNMRKYITIAALTLAGSFHSGFGQLPSPSTSPPPAPSPSATAGGGGGGGGGPCNNSSWNPELYTFYGHKDVVLEKLSKVQANLSDRRVFVQVTESERGTDAKLFVREKNGSFTVTQWMKKKPGGSLTCKIDQAITHNKGINCVGEQVIHTVLKKELESGKETHDVAAPASPEAAFSHSIKEATGEYIKTTIVILC
jgi:hypothetical protein